MCSSAISLTAATGGILRAFSSMLGPAQLVYFRYFGKACNRQGWVLRQGTSGTSIIVVYIRAKGPTGNLAYCESKFRGKETCHQPTAY